MILAASVVAVACSASAPLATTSSPTQAVAVTAAPQPTPTAAPTVAATATPFPLSEQPDQAKFSEYLSDAYLGSMPVGKLIGTDGFPARTTIFRAGSDQLCLMTQIKKTIRSGGVASSVYDPVAKVDAQPRMAVPAEWPVGGSGGCGSLPGSAGRYEYKLYIENVVVAVLPFEVK